MFDQKTCESLGFYVYALFDPASPRVPFYIGKGLNNRVFGHAAGEPMAESDSDMLSAKLDRIREIHRRGDKVVHKIIRWQLSEDEAFKLEAALIDMINHMMPETLTNQVSGHGVAEGFYDANDLATMLGSKPAEFDVPALIIKIDRKWEGLMERFGSAISVPESEIWEAVRYHWKVSKARAERAECVLAVAKGIVRGVFKPTEWVQSDKEGRMEMRERTDASNYRYLIGKSVAARFTQGNQNPIKYLNYKD